MKKTLITLIFVMFLISSVSASAVFDYTTRWYYNGNPVTNVRAMNYVCNDYNCYTLGVKVFDQTSPTNIITVPYGVPAPVQGYATYWFSECYQGQEMAWKPAVDGYYVQDVSFTKYSNCEANINSFNVPSSINENQELEATVNVASAISENSLPPYGEPDETDIVQNFLSAQTSITFTVKDSGGNTVYTKTKERYILWDTSSQLTFSWTPDYTEAGTHTIYLTTTVPDCKCGNYITQQEVRTLTVNDVNIECYTNSDCGTDGFEGDLYCNNDDVSQNYVTYFCENAGTPDSYCADITVSYVIEDCGEDEYSEWSDTYCLFDDVYHSRTVYDRGCYDAACFEDQYGEEELVEECADACYNGSCYDIECYDDSDCDDYNPYTNDFCINPGTIYSYCYYEDIECLDDDDCSYLDGDYCDGDLIRHDEGICVNNICEIDTSTLYDCDNEDVYSCDGDIVIYDDYSCYGAVCVLDSSMQYENCDDYDGIYCYEDDLWGDDGYCSAGACEIYTVMIEDCGYDEYSDWSSPYCLFDDVYHSRTVYDRGCSYDSCFENQYGEEELIEECADACYDGECEDITCYYDSDCDDYNPYTNDFCINPGTIYSYCYYEDIECLNDGDCGTDGFVGDNYCGLGDNLYIDYQEFTCFNPGTSLSYCNSTTTPQLVEQCYYGCDEDMCLNQKKDTKRVKTYEGKSVDVISVKTDTIIRAGDILPLSVTIKNNGRSDIKGLRIKVMIPELGVIDGSDYFWLREGDTKTKRFVLRLYDAEPGIYYVKILITDGDVREVRHREIEIV